MLLCLDFLITENVGKSTGYAKKQHICSYFELVVLKTAQKEKRMIKYIRKGEYMKKLVQKIFMIITAFILIVLCMAMSGCIACTSFNPANGEEYSVENCESRDTALTGKIIYWLGSSVTLGMASCEESVPDYIAARNGAICVKDAVSGTTLAGNDKNGYLYRLHNGNFDKNAKIDAFVCQVSTNDAKKKNIGRLGSVSGLLVTDKSEFDTDTVAGAMEYVIAYVVQTWNCPIYFYTNAYFSDEGYKKSKDPKSSDYSLMVDLTYELAEKWNNVGADVRIIDLFGDEDFNDIPQEDYEFYMYDAVHPYKAGYLEWWTPAFEKVMLKDFGNSVS